MIHHIQRYTVGNDAMVPGDCMQAALASLLDLPMEHVPHFALFGVNWRFALAKWIDAIGRDIRVYSDLAENAWDAAGIQRLPLVLAPHSILMIAGGDSPNGTWSHVVLWRISPPADLFLGELVHDPHPQKTGISGVPWEFWDISGAHRETDQETV